jgi:membrane protease YdiL (CAAX protease family)
VLDAQLAAAADRSPEPWGARIALYPLAAAAAVIVLTAALAMVWPGGGISRTVAGVLLSFACYGVLLATILRTAGPVARRSGGWPATFGWDWPRWRDLVPVVPALIAINLVRAAVLAAVLAVVPSWNPDEASNVRLDGRPIGVVLAVAVLAVLVAPPIEELLFRGVLLRTLARRSGFWPAALLSSVLFGLFHVHQAPSLGGAVLLGVAITVFGAGLAVLVRLTGRLAPAIAVHSLSNLIAVVLSASGALS